MPDSATFEAIQTQELDEDSLLKDTLSVKVKGDERLLNAEYMAVKSYTGNDQTFDMYRIVTDTTPDKTMSFTGMSLAPYELNGHILQDLRPVNHTLEYTLGRVLNGTDWRLGHIDSNLKNVTTTFYYVSVKEALKELQTLIGCEFVFKVEISSQKITDKWVEVYREMGNRTKKRFNYGTNALTVVRETNKADIYTALIGRGKGEEVSSAEDNASGQAGYGRKITFEDIEWSTAKGNPLNKPKGQYYIELPQATQMYGIRNIDGTMKARIGVVDFDDEEDKNRLINLTYQQLLVSSRPKVLFKATVANIGATGIGDTVTIHRHDLNMHYETRARKVVRNKLNDNKTQIELGDAVVTPSTKQAKQNNATIKNLNQEIEKVKTDITTSITSADGKNTINYGPVEPTRKRTGDTWYRPHPSLANETQMLVWNGSAWELVVDTSDLTSVGREVKSATEQAEQATQSAKDADTKAKSALDKVGVADNLLGEHQKMIASLNGQLAEDLVTDQTVTNPKTWLTNYGELVANNGYDTTDYIPVNKDDLLSLESTVSHYYKLAFYDTDKNNLGYYDGSKVVLTPSGTAYFGNTGTFNAPADGFVRLSYSTATGGTDTVKLSNQNNLYTLINSGYNNALSALKNVDRAMQEFGENLISLDSLNRGYWLDAQGKLMSNNAYKTTDYIRVDSGGRYKLIGGNAVYQVYFYNANREALSFYDGKEIKTDINNGFKYFTAAPNIEFNIPEDASYVRIASSIKDFSQVSFSKVSTMIANMLSEVDGVKQRVENDLVDIRSKANEAFEKASSYDGKLSTVEQTVDDLKGEISQKVSSAEVTESLNTFNESIKKQTSEQVSSSLIGYAKSTDLEGYATEEFATNKAVSEAGKVSNELTKYELKTGVDSKVSSLAASLREETAEKMRTVYTKEETEKLLGDKADSSVLTKYVQQATYEAGIEGISSKLSEMSSNKLDFIAFENFFDNEYKKTAQGVTDMYTKVNKIIDANGTATDTFAKAVYDRNAERQNNDFQAVTNDLVKTATYEEGINGVKQSITSVEGKIDNLSVGGRNLIDYSMITSNSGNLDKSNYVKKGLITFGITGIYSGVRIDASKLEPNTEYVMSYKYQKTSGTLVSFGGHTAKVYENNLAYVDGSTKGSLYSGNKSVFVKDDNEIHSVVVKFTTPSTITPSDLIYIQPNRGYDTKVSVNIYDWKLEKGNVATDWSPAPEDLLGEADFQIFKNNYESNDKSIKSRLIAIDSGKEGSLAYRLNETESTAKGNTTTISDIKTKPGEQITGYQTIKERSDLYERVIGSSSEASVKQNMSRIVMTDSVFQTEVVDRQNLLTAMASGTGMTRDPYFDSGNNDISVYDNNRTGTITIFRENPSNSSQPNGKWRLRVYHAASSATTPNRGGIARTTSSWVNGTVVVKFVALLPTGRSFSYNNNNLGNGYTSGWLTDNKGTGKWETYMYYYRFGSSGTFSSFGHLSVVGASSAITWYLSEYDIINVNKTSASKITQLSDNINLKVSKSDLISQINVQAGGVLITSGTNKLNITPDTTYIQNSTIKSAMIESLEADKIKTGTLDASKVKVINIDADNITANQANLIKAGFISSSGGSLELNGDLILSTAKDNSQTYIGNGITGTRNPQGATIGQIGYAYESSSPWYSMQVSHGSHFQIRMSRGDGQLNKQAFYIISGGTESYLNTDNIYLNPASSGRVRVQGAMTVDNVLRTEGTMLVRQKLEYLNGGHIESQSSSSNMLINASNKLIIYTNGSNALEFDANNAVFRRKISENSDIRLKTNIVDMPINSLEAIRNMEIKKFDYLDGRTNYYGIIAQQAQQYLPELINTDSDGYLMVDKSAMTYVNMHAIQQLDNKVDTKVIQLEQKIASLQDELALLKGA